MTAWYASRCGSLLRAVALAFIATAFLVLLAPGCGRTSLEPESLDAGSSAACGPSTCPNGCCDANGTCRGGREVRACGSAGGQCADCVGGGFSVCTNGRVCARDEPECDASTCSSGCCSVDDGRLRCLSGTQAVACGTRGAYCTDCAAEGRACDASTRACGATTCDATNCAGCCVGDKCLPGDVTAACGTGGGACDTCARGQACRGVDGGGGRCEGTPSCGPENCGGCCDAGGRCVAGVDGAACGKQGQACATCAAGEVCVPDGPPNGGTCQPSVTCGPSNCAGCCVGNQCVTATTPSACGASGQACKACGPNQICNAAGACVPTTTGCNPGNCAGCCIGDICAVGTQNTACGGGGQLCLNCANQSPPRVCTSGVCQLPACGPANCPNGCCSGNTCVVGTQDSACGPTGGAACQDCAAKNQTCQGRQCRDTCGPATCSGCCVNATTCVTGIANDACGSGGGVCANCNQTGSFCNGLVVPRRCNDQQSTCPAPYGGCDGAVRTPVTPARQNLCTDAALDGLASACASGPETPGCLSAIALLAKGCQSCLAPFRRPFDERAGLFACAASFVNQGCRQLMGCSIDCADTSCEQCLPTSEGQCYALVNGTRGQCRLYTLGAACANGALSAGQLCSQFSYANYGHWLRGVGDHFCGNGP